jgi:thymidylate kinase
MIISFSGIDGAGKSTQIQKLREYLSSNGIAVEELTFWDNVALFSSMRSGFSRRVLQSDGNVGTPDRPAERRDKNKQNIFLITGRCVLHVFDVLNLRRIFHQARSRNLGVVIFDRYIYDQLAALPLNSVIARAYARFILKLAPKPDLALLLDAIPEVARARKPEYPVDFMRQYRSSYLRLCDFTNLRLVRAGDVDEVQSAIRAHLDGLRSTASADNELQTALPA